MLSQHFLYRSLVEHATSAGNEETLIIEEKKKSHIYLSCINILLYHQIISIFRGARIFINSLPFRVFDWKQFKKKIQFSNQKYSMNKN